MARRPQAESTATLETIPLDCIRADGSINPRAGGCDTLTVEEYTVSWEIGVEFPPLVVYRDEDGTTWLSEGFHRLEAARLAEGIEAVACEVREGGKREALLNAVGSNATHGRRRTNEDKRRAVELVLGLKEKLSNRKIAELCAVSHEFVNHIVKGHPAAELKVATVATFPPPEYDTSAIEHPDPSAAELTRAIAAKVAAFCEQEPDDDEPDCEPDEPSTPKPFDFRVEADKVEKLCRSVMDRWPSDKRDLLSKIFVQMSKEALHWA